MLPKSFTRSRVALVAAMSASLIVASPVAAQTARGEADTVRAVFILRDGNWRVEHLTRESA